LSLGIECLTEFHDIQTALTQGRADWRGRIGLTGRDLQLDVADNLLGHFLLLKGESYRVFGFPNNAPLYWNQSSAQQDA
jgi:hypothetical protein